MAQIAQGAACGSVRRGLDSSTVDGVKWGLSANRAGGDVREPTKVTEKESETSLRSEQRRWWS